MTDLPTAVTLRRWATQCAARANHPRANADELERLLKMRTALLDLAETGDWLDGDRRPPLRAAG